MKKQKLYFSSIIEDMAYTKEYLIDEMKERELTAIEVNLVKRELETDYFYCHEFGDFGEVGESCGKICDKYSPRNGKSGCCKHRGFCYIPGKEFILTIDGKLHKLPL